MNYIELFLNDHDLVVGQPFKISISPKLWFYFCAEAEFNEATRTLPLFRIHDLFKQKYVEQKEVQSEILD